jgi:two-component system, OmpR family, sensor histidine kinase VicK
MAHNDDNSEKTEILYGYDRITGNVLHSFPHLDKSLDICYEPLAISYVVSNEPIMNAGRDLVHRGGKMRVVTEITNDNIAACKELMKIADLRHLEGIMNTFSVSEKHYFGHVTQGPEGELSQAIHSNARKYVESQRYLFETLWKNAIPAKQRIREIEEGAKREVVEIFRDPVEIQKISYDLIKSAKKEILLIFSAASAFHHQIKAGALLQLLKEVASLHRVKVRILVPMEQKTINEMAGQLEGLGIVVRDNKKPLQATTVTTLVVDKAYSLTVELQDDTKEMSEREAIVLATYSNSQSTALSYVSKFETLWMQNEIYHPGRHISWRQF